MATTVTNLPGLLNLAFRQSDEFRTTLDFDTTAEGVTATSEIVSYVTGQTVAQFQTTAVDVSSGEFLVRLSAAQTGDIAAGTYKWRHVWDSVGDNQRTMLSGFVEVVK